MPGQDRSAGFLTRWGSAAGRTPPAAGHRPWANTVSGRRVAARRDAAAARQTRGKPGASPGLAVDAPAEGRLGAGGEALVITRIPSRPWGNRWARWVFGGTQFGSTPVVLWRGRSTVGGDGGRRPAGPTSPTSPARIRRTGRSRDVLCWASTGRSRSHCRLSSGCASVSGLGRSRVDPSRTNRGIRSRGAATVVHPGPW